ncbi:hypothetical protein KDK_43630 [Dictyobacter kobayashii]|uniref:Uncharacterized protein n=1 Tax=Dictyobacter kobayashii TaxID=2014872 RepID=A0A402AN29_9CHLR|nr:hypothetical protein KDK_43630 [Dictyobacter kobayashii]
MGGSAAAHLTHSTPGAAGAKEKHEIALQVDQGYFMFVQRMFIFQVWNVCGGRPQGRPPHTFHTPNPAPQVPKRSMKKPSRLILMARH